MPTHINLFHRKIYTNYITLSPQLAKIQKKSGEIKTNLGNPTSKSQAALYFFLLCIKGNLITETIHVKRASTWKCVALRSQAMSIMENELLFRKTYSRRCNFRFLFHPLYVHICRRRSLSTSRAAKFNQRAHYVRIKVDFALFLSLSQRIHELSCAIERRRFLIFHARR